MVIKWTITLNELDMSDNKKGEIINIRMKLFKKEEDICAKKSYYG
ncbi:hypothetical protein J18TS1_00530 [Oceanobacillus oncorhynchi subsp. incaldanensis]|nr:hypothetical protein J18TS1_00530 [Oceanobacillus oncorhynchi subsp. incaldanensis]